MADQVKKDKQVKKDISRKNFLKIGGLAAAAVQVGAVAKAGLEEGKDVTSYTGWSHLEGKTQFFNREPHEFDGLPYSIHGETRRPEPVDGTFGRMEMVMKEMGMDMSAMMGGGNDEQDDDSEGMPSLPPGMELTPDKLPMVIMMLDPEKLPEGITMDMLKNPDTLPEDFDLNSLAVAFDKSKIPGGITPPGGDGQDGEAPPAGGFAAMMASLKMPALEDIKNEELLKYFADHPGEYELFKHRFDVIHHIAAADAEKYKAYYTLINAFSNSWSTGTPPTSPPEISDFTLQGDEMMGPSHIPDPVPFKSKVLASELIKKMAHIYGATLVGITKLNPDWVLNYDLRGTEGKGSYEVPEHWEYVIAIGIPHEWEMVLGNPHVGTSFDAYSRATVAAERLEKLIKNLGYPARAHTPMGGYDLIGVPILQDAGLGQQGRHGIVITPELGSNCRASFVTTSLPMEIDLPIDFGVSDFCKDCKICAEICPSQSISYDDDDSNQIKRGYQHWEINQTSCFNFWSQSQGGIGCRVCLIACPYSRRNNWVHDMARRLDTADPTGLANNGLIWAQKTFFDNPESTEMLPPPDGVYQNYREPASWLMSENYFDLDIKDPTKGE